MYRVILLYAYYNFNVYFFKFFVGHIFLGKFGRKIGSFPNRLKFWVGVHCYMSYVPTLLFWTGGSCFHWATPVLSLISEMSCFEMILALMSDIYESSKLITLSIKLMWKTWVLVTKLDECIALGHHLHHEQKIRVSRSTYCFATSEKSTGNEFENQQFVIFKPWKVLKNWKYLIWYCYIVWIFEKILVNGMQN